MIDINAIFAQAVSAAIAQAVAPLEERVKQLEVKLSEAQLFQRTTHIDINAATDALNQQEWFWEKINGYIAAGVEAGLEDHTGTYDHDDFVSSNDLPDIDDIITEDKLPDFEEFVTKDDVPDLDDVITTDNINEHIEEYLTRVRITRI
jgi:hypothetical protein